MDKTLLGKRINTARKERGLTSERLSEACGINATYLRQIESGAKVPSLQVFVLLCQALRVSTYRTREMTNFCPRRFSSGNTPWWAKTSRSSTWISS